MAGSQTSEALAQVWRGHALLLACAVLYLAWWVMFFRPNAPKVTGLAYAVGVVCILGAAVCGIAGAGMVGTALGEVSGAESVPRLGFVVGGVVAYVVLLALTTGLFHRQVTTELLLIVAWGALEACVVATLTASGEVATPALVVLGALVALLVIVSLVCYVLYYRLGPTASFVDGMVPLVAVGIEAAVTMALVG